MKKYISFLVKSILAGIMIGIGGTIFLSCSNKFIGAILFAIGLFIIVTRDFNLFTGKIGYVFENPPKYLIEVIITLIGNFIGTFIVGFVLRYTRISKLIMLKANEICLLKLNDNILSILILSFFCGILMYIAVNGYKTISDNIGKNIVLFLCVVVFILCGFEHCIANMYYFSIANMWNFKSFLYLLIMILGNSFGGVFIPLSNKLIKNGK